MKNTQLVEWQEDDEAIGGLDADDAFETEASSKLQVSSRHCDMRMYASLRVRRLCLR